MSIEPYRTHYRLDFSSCRFLVPKAKALAYGGSIGKGEAMHDENDAHSEGWGLSQLETLLVHAGAEVDAATGAVAPPIHLSTTFEHGPGGELEAESFSYGRADNPSQRRLETALAAAEGGQEALVFGSGMAAAAALFQALPAGSHVILPQDVYHGVRELSREHFPRWGLHGEEVNLTDLEAVRAALRPETRLVWAESPSNPLLQITDIGGLGGLVRDAGAWLVVDGTFTTPVLQRPFELGADFVMHSTTKYLGGHSDVMGGALIFRDREILYPTVLESRLLLGGVASPFASWLVLRGLRTLACRMERHCANAHAVARALADHPQVERVFYPGLPEHPGHGVAQGQMKAFGGMVSFTVAGGRDAAVVVAGGLRLFTNATSLGGVESLVEHRRSMEGPTSETPENLLRLSIGLEHPEDLVADLMDALDRVEG